MTEKQAQARAKEIFDSLTEAQKNHLQNLYNDKIYWERTGKKQDANAYGYEISHIKEFLTAGEASSVWSAFSELLNDYNYNRYNKEQKHIDDLFLGK